MALRRTIAVFVAAGLLVAGAPEARPCGATLTTGIPVSPTDGEVGLPTNAVLIARTEAYPLSYRLRDATGTEIPIDVNCEGGENGTPSFCLGRPAELAPLTSYIWTLVATPGGDDVLISFTTGMEADTTQPLVSTTRVVIDHTETVDNGTCGVWELSTWAIGVGAALEPGFMVLRAPEWSASLAVPYAAGDTETELTVRGYPSCLGIRLFDRAANELVIAPLEGACPDSEHDGSGCVVGRTRGAPWMTVALLATWLFLLRRRPAALG
jgi:hypothetical protein